MTGHQLFMYRQEPNVFESDRNQNTQNAGEATRNLGETVNVRFAYGLTRS